MKQQHDEQQPTTPDRDETRSRTVRGVSPGSVGHTPGQWLAVRDPGHYHSLSTVVAGDARMNDYNRRLRVEVGGWAGPEEQEANARLIAAAPDLLAALIGVVRVADRATDEFDAARAAIARATGASHD